MASKNNWINIINNLNDAYQWSSYTTADVKNGKNKYGLVQKYSSSSDGGKYLFTPVYKNIGKANSGGSNSTATTDNLFVPVRIRAKNVGNSVVTQAFVGRVMDSTMSDTMIRAGVVVARGYEIVMAVASVCGYSIGEDTAKDIYNWLQRRHFDWGPSAVSGTDKIYAIGIPSGNDIKTYVEYKLYNRLVIQLNSWGLWNLNPSGIVPIKPVLNEMTEYDFRGRFPAVPNKWVEPLERVINEMVNPNAPLTWPTISPTTNWYMQVLIDNDGQLTFNIFGNFSGDTNKKNFTYRSPKMNGEGTFRGYSTDDPEEERDIVIKLRAQENFCYVYRWVIDPDGDMKLRPRMENYGEVTWYFSDYKNLAGVAYDNFDYYRPITQDEDGKIRLGAPTRDISQTVIDANAVDLRHTDIKSEKSPLNNVWTNRIYVSSPNFDQEIFETPSAMDLNEYLPYIQMRIPKGIIEGSTQQSSFWGLTEGDLIQDMIDRVPETMPFIGTQPSPLPIDPPSINPVIPTLPDGVNVSGLIHLYSVTSGQNGEAAAFHNWLWSINLESFLRIVQNPMDAIIGMHAIFATPEGISHVSDVIVGNLLSGTGATLIKQYTHLPCGFVTIKPYFNNINDIVATKVQLFLPFIGFVDINTADLFVENTTGTLVGKSLYVDYYIDFLTGSCIACISTQDGSNSTNNYLYQFTGNCAVEVPITSANYADILRNTISMAGGITKNSTGIETISQAISSSQIPVQRSGSCGGNAGAMGIKKPYLVITRTKSVDAENRKHFEGSPQNMNVRLGSMSGYTRVKYINLEGLSCTEEEKDDILAKLQGGVFI